MITKKQDYNSVPVEYCTKCLSLAIKTLDKIKNEITEDIPYCGDCGVDTIDICHIDEHIVKYKALYGKPYVTRDK